MSPTKVRLNDPSLFKGDALCISSEAILLMAHTYIVGIIPVNINGAVINLNAHWILHHSSPQKNIN